MVNFLLFDEPGIYSIYCLKNQKYYIGETVSLLERFGSHVGRLKKQNHDSKALQHDWNCYGPENFSFQILDSGSKYNEKSYRIQKENEWIQYLSQKFGFSKLYNTLPSSFVHTQPIFWNRKKYKTLQQFRQAYQEKYPQEFCSKTTIRRRIQNSSLEGQVILGKRFLYP